MPFKSAAQERALFAKNPDLARKWVHKYGHAPGFKTHNPKNFRKEALRKIKENAAKSRG